MEPICVVCLAALALIVSMSAATAVERVLGITDSRNAASLRLLERVGFQPAESRPRGLPREPCREHVFVLRREDRDLIATASRKMGGDDDPTS